VDGVPAGSSHIRTAQRRGQHVGRRERGPRRLSDEDGESGSKNSPTMLNKRYQRRPRGIKAAKLTRSGDTSMEKQVKASTAAVDKPTVAQKERTTICFFDSPAMRHTPKAAKYRNAVLRKMTQSAGLAAASAPAPTSEPPTSRAVHEIEVLKVDDGVADMDVTLFVCRGLCVVVGAAGGRLCRRS